MRTTGNEWYYINVRTIDLTKSMIVEKSLGLHWRILNCVSWEDACGVQGKSEDDEVENVNDQIECLRGIVLNSQTIMNDGPIEKKKIQNEKLVAA